MNRTGGLPLDVSKVRRIWPCQGGEGHFIARLVKAGTPRALPAPGTYTAEEELWLAAAAEQSKKQKGSKGGKPAKAPDARSARRESSRALREAVQGRSARSRDAGAGEATPAQSLAAWQEFAQQYFPALADRPAVVHGGSVLLPVPFPQTGLHVLRAGVFVGSVQKGRFVPEHHLFTAFGALCQNRRRGHCRRWLVLRDRGWLPHGRRQGVGRTGQKPLPQGPAAAVNRPEKPVFQHE